MSKRLILPVTTAGPKPTVDVIRKRLGGRASTQSGAGEVISWTRGDGGLRPGVVLFVQGEDLDVWFDHGIVRRIRRSSAAPLHAAPPRDVASIAEDARIFGGLSEGQRVGYHDGAGTGEAVLVEKCRFGALLQRDDGTIMGVGFRKVWPIPGRIEHQRN
jgi:hypothetical protein